MCVCVCVCLLIKSPASASLDLILGRAGTPAAGVFCFHSSSSGLCARVGRGGHVEAAGCFVVILGDIIFIICTEATQRSERASAAQLPPGVHRRRREQRCGAFIVKVMSLFEAQKMAEFGLFAVRTNIDKFSGIF